MVRHLRGLCCCTWIAYSRPGIIANCAAGAGVSVADATPTEPTVVPTGEQTEILGTHSAASAILALSAHCHSGASADGLRNWVVLEVR